MHLKSNNQKVDENLVHGNLKKHIKRLAIPASIGFLFNTLFNVVDTIYAGQISTDALAGLTISFPVFFIIIALSSGFGSGLTSLLSISIGTKNRKEMHDLLINGVLIGVVFSFCLMILSPVIIKPLLALTGASDQPLAYGVLYTQTIFFGSVFFLINAIFNGFLSAQGDTKSYRNFLMIGFLLNLILDPLFIFGWFGLPQLGVFGIALATIIVQMIGSIYLCFRLIKSTYFDKAMIKKARASIYQILSILKQGVPASLNMATIAIGIFIINYFVLKFGGTVAIAGYGAAVRIEQLALLPALGLNVAALTITGQNFGAKNYQRIIEVRKKTMFYGAVIMLIGAFIIFPLAPFLIRIFDRNHEVIEIGTRYLRIEVLAFVTYVLMSISNSTLQGIKKPNFVLLIGIYRQFLPFFIFQLLGQYLNMGLDGIWWGIVIINWTAVLWTEIYVRTTLKKLRHSQMIA